VTKARGKSAGRRGGTKLARETIRRAAMADAKALAELRWEFRTSVGKAVEDRAKFLKRCVAWMRKRLSDAGAWRCWVAADASGLQGSLWLQVIEKLPNPVDEVEVHGYITSFYVRPGARGRRLGTRLLDKALAFCRSLPVHAVILWPTAESRTLYGRRGFAEPDDLMELIVSHP
jgi:GNAT superfamily N-acetyltransferase